MAGHGGLVAVASLVFTLVIASNGDGVGGSVMQYVAVAVGPVIHGSTLH